MKFKMVGEIKHHETIEFDLLTHYKTKYSLWTVKGNFRDVLYRGLDDLLENLDSEGISIDPNISQREISYEIGNEQVTARIPLSWDILERPGIPCSGTSSKDLSVILRSNFRSPYELSISLSPNEERIWPSHNLEGYEFGVDVKMEYKGNQSGHEILSTAERIVREHYSKQEFEEIKQILDSKV